MGQRSCARCGMSVPIGKHIYSKYTKSYYCWNLEDCDKRTKRQAAASEKKARKEKNDDMLRMVQEMADGVRKEIEEHGFETF